MREFDKTYYIYDGTIGIWREHVDERVRETYDEIRMMMMNDGWSFHQDPEIKKRYKLISDDHHAGHKRGICFLSSINGRHIEFKFYEPVIRDNPNGGQYTYAKMKKMPYLLRLKVQVALNKIVAYLAANGYVDHSKTYPEDGLAAIMKHRQELCDFKGKDFYQRERQSYNVIDADGKEMFDGDVRYFWTYSGSLHRGVVYRNINNMWWVHTGPYSYQNIANFKLFTWTPAMGRRRRLQPDQVEQRLNDELGKAVKQQKFERAIVLRDLIGRKAA